MTAYVLESHLIFFRDHPEDIIVQQEVVEHSALIFGDLLKGIIFELVPEAFLLSESHRGWSGCSHLFC